MSRWTPLARLIAIDKRSKEIARIVNSAVVGSIHVEHAKSLLELADQIHMLTSASSVELFEQMARFELPQEEE